MGPSYRMTTTIPSHMDTNHLGLEAAFSLWPRLRAFLLAEGVITT